MTNRFTPDKKEGTTKSFYLNTDIARAIEMIAKENRVTQSQVVDVILRNDFDVLDKIERLREGDE